MCLWGWEASSVCAKTNVLKELKLAFTGAWGWDDLQWTTQGQLDLTNPEIVSVTHFGPKPGIIYLCTHDIVMILVFLV